MLDALSDGFAILDQQWRFVYLNAAGAAPVSQMAPGTGNVIGRDHWEVFPDARGSELETAYRRAAAMRRNCSPPWRAWCAGLSAALSCIPPRRSSETRRVVRRVAMCWPMAVGVPRWMNAGVSISQHLIRLPGVREGTC